MQGQLGPEFRKKIGKHKKYTRGCTPHNSGTGDYEIDCDDRTWIVNLKEKMWLQDVAA